LDVSATFHAQNKYVSVYVVNRSQTEALETTISLDGGQFAGDVQAYVVNGPDIKAENTFAQPDQVRTAEQSLSAEKHAFTYTFEPHSVTALVCAL
jgi:alpha-N-arabinofuranosidase